jgi:hypothetical protein
MSFSTASQELAEALAKEHQSLGQLLKAHKDRASSVTMQILIDAATKAYNEARKARDKAQLQYEKKIAVASDE